MKEITKKSLQNLWDYCQEAYDDDQQATKFFSHIDQLLGRGDVDFDLVMDFVRENDIKRVKPATRAKTVTGAGKLYSPEYQKRKKAAPKPNPLLPKQPRGRNAYPGDSCGQSSPSC